MIDQLKGSRILFAENNFDSLIDFLNDNSSSQIFVLTDENTRKHCLPLITHALKNNFTINNIEIESGEHNKKIETCIFVWNKLSEFGADKNSLLINLGGGVVTDIGGFVASTYLRGINFINIPTSLMGMVDASIGGKNGVDRDSIKNQIGLISFPLLVFIFPEFLKTLNDRNFKNGLAEIYKHGLIADKNLWNRLLLNKINRTNIKEILVSAIEIKSSIVSEDPFELGKRKILNFGHSIGHALESCLLNSEGQQLFHGEAIVAGMIMETWLSEKYCGLTPEESNEITNNLFTIFGKENFSQLDFDEFLGYLKHDKKNQHQQFNFSLLNAIGSCKWNIPVSKSDVKIVFDRYNAI